MQASLKQVAMPLVAMFAIAQLAYSLWIPVKASVAQVLLESAWRKSRGVARDTAEGVRPWPWADTWPVAELVVERHGIRQIVLAGDSGAALAFGPGMSLSGEMPGRKGVTLISGHRDTHFRFLERVKRGDVIMVNTNEGTYVYEVYDMRVIDAAAQSINPVTPYDELVLVTCYPFDAVVPGGLERYVVAAVSRGETTSTGRREESSVNNDKNL